MEDIIIGDVNFDESIVKGRKTPIEEALKITFNRLGDCFIKIKSNEGPIPHFHIDKKSGETVCCVQIYLPKYFHHLNGEIDLTPRQKEILDNALKDYWKELDKQWRQAYGGPLFENWIKNNGLDIRHLTKPDYTLL